MHFGKFDLILRLIFYRLYEVRPSPKDLADQTSLIAEAIDRDDSLEKIKVCDFQDGLKTYFIPFTIADSCGFNLMGS